ncbi:COX15/CtaA family protein [Alkalimarinus coralli]|uniref:COX15/CtaA family protein n=1 Tax=Alkalimarinus coralli TaxID=2935863 RepID=UPI00202B03D8|nr:COX15/CtaA family protein [Alkalimarinus coralli]
MTVTIRRVAIATTLLAAFVVALGAYTRLKDAGLGCPDWPGCYGFLTVPEHVDDIKIAEARFPDTPVDADKGWPEMIHRYFASLLGLLIVIQAALCIRYVKRQSSLAPLDAAGTRLPLKLPLFLVLLVICQGLFGMWTVTLKLWPQVVSGHLLGGFATLSLLFLFVLRMSKRLSSTEQVDNRRHKTFLVSNLSKWAMVGLLLVVLQIFLGAWTASNYAALACPDFPTCQGAWLPEMNVRSGFNLFQSIGPNYLGGVMDNESRVAIHVVHRLGALFLSVYLLIMSWHLWRGASKAVKVALFWVLSALVMQVTLGILNVVWLIPLPLAVAHNAGGALLLLTMVYLNFQLFNVYSSRSEGEACSPLAASPNITKTNVPHYAKSAEVIS